MKEKKMFYKDGNIWKIQDRRGELPAEKVKTLEDANAKILGGDNRNRHQIRNLQELDQYLKGHQSSTALERKYRSEAIFRDREKRRTPLRGNQPRSRNQAKNSH